MTSRPEILVKIGRVALALLAGYLILRGVVEFFIVDPSRPEEYADARGGPTY